MGLIARRYMGVRTLSFPTVTLTGLTCNLSMVDGTAFITNPSVDLTQYRGCKITLQDTSGYKAVGWIKAAGAGESLDSEAFSNWQNVNEINRKWNTLTPNVNGHDIDSAIKTEDIYAQAYSALQTNCLGRLYKIVYSHTKNSGTDPSIALTEYNVGGGAVSLTQTTDGTYYATAKSANMYGFYNLDYYTRGNSSSIALSLKQVLTPSATGVTIVSAQEGATYNWAAKHSGFLPNATSFTATIEA